MKNNDDELSRGAEFITKHWAAMIRIAQLELEDKGCAAPETHAEDIAGSVSLTLVRKWEELISHLGAMYVFTARRARSHARKCRREELADETDERSVPFLGSPGLDPEQILEQAEFIEWALSLLNEQEADVIIKRFFEDLAFASIAELLGKPLGTVTSICSRALEKIRKADAQQAALSSAPQTRVSNSPRTPKA
jgi:RNA polymerase sigma factor (sigma-70 family)